MDILVKKVKSLLGMIVDGDNDYVQNKITEVRKRLMEGK